MSGGAFGVRLRGYRRAAGLSQQELADRSGLSVRAISNLERGITQWPYRDSLYRLAAALDLRDADRADFLSTAGRRLGGDVPDAADPRGGDADQSLTDADTDEMSLAPRQLPLAAPVFVGRQAQLQALSAVLDQPGGTALITAIGGTAGVGKTALAVHWAHQNADRFPDGQLFVNLRGYDPTASPMPPDDAIRVLLDALRVPASRLPQTAEARVGLYRSLLIDRRMLVLLDNARDVAQVRPLLPNSPTCRVLVTSRDQLAGLAVVEAAQPLVLDVLTDDEARQLLRERIADGRVDAEPAAVDSLIAACARLPLALCVIAARAAMRPGLPLAEIAAELARPEARLDAFTAGGDDPATDVRTVLSWSYRYLDDAAARCFRFAGLHPGAFLEPRALAVLLGERPERAERLLGQLATAHLVQPNGTLGYGMHDLLRGYARELVLRRDREVDRRSALSDLFTYYLHAAATAMDLVLPAERSQRPRPDPAPRPLPLPEFAGQHDASAWLDAERPNLVAAALAAARDWPRLTVDLAAILFRYLSMGAHHAESVAVHNAAREAARRLGDPAAEATALLNLAYADLRRGRLRDAVGSMEAALTLYQSLDQPSGHARALSSLGIALLLRGEAARSVDLFEQALTLYQRIADQVGEHRALANLAFAARRQGRYAVAVDYMRQVLAQAIELDDVAGELVALGGLGEIALEQGRYEDADAYLAEAVARCREFGDPAYEADLLASAALASLRQGQLERAAADLDRALELARGTGDLSTRALVLNALGELQLHTGEFARAQDCYEEALATATDMDDAYEMARAQRGLGEIAFAVGDPDAARRRWRQALASFDVQGSPLADEVRARLVESEP